MIESHGVNIRIPKLAISCMIAGLASCPAHATERDWQRVVNTYGMWGECVSGGARAHATQASLIDAAGSVVAACETFSGPYRAALADWFRSDAGDNGGRAAEMVALVRQNLIRRAEMILIAERR